MRWTVATCLALLAGCRADVAVSPPEQQRMPADPAALGPLVRMSQIDAERHFVSGIYQLEDNAWRWCAGKAELRVRLGPVENLKYLMKYAVPVQVMARAGSVRLQISLNGKKWEEIRHDKDGIYEIEKPAPAELLKPNAENIIRLEVDKPLPAEAGGRELGFILVHAGFQPL
jgi:hypothetical protein